MEQLEFFEVPSPCVRRCVVDDKGYCVGCMRKRSERFQWNEFTNDEKRHIIKLCKARYRRKVLAGKVIPTNQEKLDNSPSSTVQPSLFD